MTHYEIGHAAELAIKHELEAEGFFVLRSAGSHQLDLIAVRCGKCLFLECKSTKDIAYYPRRSVASLGQMRAFYDLCAAMRVPGFYAVQFKGVKGSPIMYFDLTALNGDPLNAATGRNVLELPGGPQA